MEQSEARQCWNTGLASDPNRYWRSIMAENSLIRFSENLSDPQCILSAAAKLLARPDEAGENVDLVRSMIEIANSMVGGIAVEMEDSSD